MKASEPKLNYTTSPIPQVFPHIIDTFLYDRMDVTRPIRVVTKFKISNLQWI